MHYVRLLRPPDLVCSPRGTQARLVLTITTDLSDAFLCPHDAVGLVVTAEMLAPSGPSSCELPGSRALRWRPGARVAKPVLELPPEVQRALAAGHAVDLCVGTAARRLSADGLRDVLEAAAAGEGLVMPVRVPLSGPRADAAAAAGLSVRRLGLGGPADTPPPWLEVEEDLGESMARHIWDGGVAALAAVAGAYRLPGLAPSRHRCMQALRRTLDGGEPAVNVLELGCGIGILGTGLGAVLARDRTILLTDVADAAARASANIARLAAARRPGGGPRLLYEDLDWELGRHGRFGPQLRCRPWRLVVLSDCTYNTDTLPALVGTLSALHAHNAGLEPGGGPTRVFLATKPRHASERAVFGLLADGGWTTLETQTLPLPLLGGEAEAVDMYLLQKD